MKPAVAVLSAGPNGLGVARSLYLQGLRPIVISRHAADVVNYSRLPAKKIVLSADDQASELLACLQQLPAETIVIPTSDWFVSFLADHNDELKHHVRFLLPSPAVATMLIDKARETECVAAILPVPATVQQLTDAEALCSTLSLPIIIKPRSHLHMVLGTKNRILYTEQDVQQFFANYADVLSCVIAQEVIVGADNCQWVCNCFFDQNSNMVQAFSFNRLRLSPSHYGVTSYAISQHNEEVFALSERLGKALAYVGPAMIEFKFDQRDQTYKYIELNPRLGMCNFFDSRCGVNNAYAYYQTLVGNDLVNRPCMQDNVMFLSGYEDFFSRRNDGEHIIAILRDYLRHILKPHVFIYHVWWDPMPSFRMLLKQLRSVINAVAKRVKRND